MEGTDGGSPTSSSGPVIIKYSSQHLPSQIKSPAHGSNSPAANGILLLEKIQTPLLPDLPTSPRSLASPAKDSNFPLSYPIKTQNETEPFQTQSHPPPVITPSSTFPPKFESTNLPAPTLNIEPNPDTFVSPSEHARLLADSEKLRASNRSLRVQLLGAQSRGIDREALKKENDRLRDKLESEQSRRISELMVVKKVSRKYTYPYLFQTNI